MIDHLVELGETNQLYREANEVIAQSIIELIQYSNKYQVLIPKTEELESILLRIQNMIERTAPTVDFVNEMKSYYGVK